MNNVDGAQKYLITQAKTCVDELRRLLERTSECLNDSEMFPTHLKDIKSYADTLMLLQAQHDCLQNFKKGGLWHK